MQCAFSKAHGSQMRGNEAQVRRNGMGYRNEKKREGEGGTHAFSSSSPVGLFLLFFFGAPPADPFPPSSSPGPALEGPSRSLPDPEPSASVAMIPRLCASFRLISNASFISGSSPPSSASPPVRAELFIVLRLLGLSLLALPFIPGGGWEGSVEDWRRVVVSRSRSRSAGVMEREVREDDVCLGMVWCDWAVEDALCFLCDF